MCNIAPLVNNRKEVHYPGIRFFSNVTCWCWTFNPCRWDHSAVSKLSSDVVPYPRKM